MQIANIHCTATSLRSFNLSDHKVDSLNVLGANPPRKRQRTAMSTTSTSSHSSANAPAPGHAPGSGSGRGPNGLAHELQPRHQIWGRSDTNLLSFDVRRCQEFLNKFERDVLRGTELDKMGSKEQMDFLKKRCQEFVKMLQELRDYVLHLRVCNAFKPLNPLSNDIR